MAFSQMINGKIEPVGIQKTSQILVSTSQDIKHKLNSKVAQLKK
jgi:hypothetical protein